MYFVGMILLSSRRVILALWSAWYVSCEQTPFYGRRFDHFGLAAFDLTNTHLSDFVQHFNKRLVLNIPKLDASESKEEEKSEIWKIFSESSLTCWRNTLVSSTHVSTQEDQLSASKQNFFLVPFSALSTGGNYADEFYILGREKWKNSSKLVGSRHTKSTGSLQTASVLLWFLWRYSQLCQIGLRRSSRSHRWWVSSRHATVVLNQYILSTPRSYSFNPSDTNLFFLSPCFLQQVLLQWKI